MHWISPLIPLPQVVCDDDDVDDNDNDDDVDNDNGNVDDDQHDDVIMMYTGYLHSYPFLR